MVTEKDIGEIPILKEVAIMSDLSEALLSAIEQGLKVRFSPPTRDEWKDRGVIRVEINDSPLAESVEEVNRMVFHVSREQVESVQSFDLLAAEIDGRLVGDNPLEGEETVVPIPKEE